MDYVIETEMPDGVNWFGGIITKVVQTSKGKIELPVNFWTTYEREALRFDSKEKAEDLNTKLLAGCDAKVIPESEANFKYSYKKIADGVYLGAKRVCNLQLGESFVESETANIFYKAVKLLENEQQMICKQYNRHRNKSMGLTKTFSLKSRYWIYVIYDTKQTAKDALN
jgi:hypothetical protein